MSDGKHEALIWVAIGFGVAVIGVMLLVAGTSS